MDFLKNNMERGENVGKQLFLSFSLSPTMFFFTLLKTNHINRASLTVYCKLPTISDSEKDAF